MSKLYIFLDDDGNVIEKVVANNHTEAVLNSSDQRIIRAAEELPYGMDFYTETIEENTES